MAEVCFDEIMDEVFRSEGGYVNDPKDPGGETNFGISKRSHPREDIRGMTKARAKAIYHRDYWGKIKGRDLQPGSDLVAMDAAVNSGASRSTKWLQRAAGLKGKAIDGRMGPVSVKAINAAQAVPLIRRACANRMGFLRTLRIWTRFGKGWSNRVARVEAYAIKLSVRYHNGPVAADQTLAANSEKAQEKSATGRNAGHTTAAGGATGGIASFDAGAIPEWVFFVAIGATALITLYLYSKSKHDEARAKAMRAAIDTKGSAK